VQIKMRIFPKPLKRALNKSSAIKSRWQMKLIVTLPILVTLLFGCAFFRKPGNLGTYALCLATGVESPCLSGDDIVEQANKTGFWDLTLNFPDVVDGVGTLIRLSDAFGMKRVGNITQCIPTLREDIQRRKVERSGTWKDYKGFALRPEDFVRLENVQRLGPHFANLHSVHVHIYNDDILDESIDTSAFLLKFREGLSDLNSVCRAMLMDTQNVYVVTEALAITKISYAFHKAGKRDRLQLDPNLTREYVVLPDDTKYSYSANGRLERITPIYVAVKAAMSLNSFGKGAPDPNDLQHVLRAYCGALKSCTAY
jgi:hypothetical protein